MSAHTPLLQQSSMLSGRQMILLVIVALHALLISALMTMHMHVDIPTVIPPMVGQLLPPDPQQSPPPAQMAVDIQVPRLDVPRIVLPPLVAEADAVAVSPATDAGVPDPAPVPAAGSAGAGEVAPIAATALQFHAVRPADDFYPDASLRMQEQGTAIVRVCVAPSGQLEGRPVIDASSGSPRLDAAALSWAREALRFTPATRAGVPVSACKGFRVNFMLH